MSRKWITAGACVLLAGFAIYLWTAGYRNLTGYAMLLLCPLMHLFMHRGHGHGEDQTSGAQDSKKPACH